MNNHGLSIADVKLIKEAILRNDIEVIQRYSLVYLENLSKIFPSLNLKSYIKTQMVKNQISNRDYPNLYDNINIDLDSLGCIMLNTMPIPTTQFVKNGDKDLYYGTDHNNGAVGETEAHVTLLYGLLENGHVWKDKVDAVLADWQCSSVKIEKIGYFDLGESIAIVALLEKTPELIDGHERLTLLPHINTFSEYVPHITLAYISKEADLDKWVKTLNKRYKGQLVATLDINYGDEPDDDNSTVIPSDTMLAINRPQTRVETPTTSFSFEHEHGHVHTNTDAVDAATNALDLNDQEIVLLQQANLENAIKGVDDAIVAKVIEHLRNGDIQEAKELLMPPEESGFLAELIAILTAYYLTTLPIYAQMLFVKRLSQFGKMGVFNTGDKEVEDYTKTSARDGAESHVNTILIDLQKAIDKTVAKNPAYDLAKREAEGGASIDEIVSAITSEYREISKNRAKVIAKHESSKVFTMSQFQADKQFLKEAGLTDKAYKRLRSRTNEPCPICAYLIKETHANPIPFNQNFASLGDTITTSYKKENGKMAVAKMTVGYENIKSGNVHVQCNCEYELVIKNDDGTWLNNVRELILNEWNPELHPRDKEGKFKDKATRLVDEIYSEYPQLQDQTKRLAAQLKIRRIRKDKMDNLPTGTNEWFQAYEKYGKIKLSFDTDINKAAESMGINKTDLWGLFDEWSGGNGPRDKDGHYISKPDLELNKNSDDVIKAQKLTQAILFESGIKSVPLYRGQPASIKANPKGLTSFTTSKLKAGLFGHELVERYETNPTTGVKVKVHDQIPPKVIAKEIPLHAIVSHHRVLFNSQYTTEAEVIVDMDKL